MHTTRTISPKTTSSIILVHLPNRAGTGSLRTPGCTPSRPRLHRLWAQPPARGCLCYRRKEVSRLNDLSTNSPTLHPGSDTLKTTRTAVLYGVCFGFSNNTPVIGEPPVSQTRKVQPTNPRNCLHTARKRPKKGARVSQPARQLHPSGQHRTHGERGGWFLRTVVLDVAALSGGESRVRWISGCHRVRIGVFLRVSGAFWRRRWVRGDIRVFDGLMAVCGWIVDSGGWLRNTPISWVWRQIWLSAIRVCFVFVLCCVGVDCYGGVNGGVSLGTQAAVLLVVGCWRRSGSWTLGERVSSAATVGRVTVQYVGLPGRWSVAASVATECRSLCVYPVVLGSVRNPA